MEFGFRLARVSRGALTCGSGVAFLLVGVFVDE